MEKALVHLTGAFFFSLLLLGAYFLYWGRGADEAESWVRSNFAEHEKRLNSVAGSQVSITYESINRTGFPFSRAIKIYRPTLTVTTNRGTIRLQSAFLLFTPEDEAVRRYRIEMPQSLIVSYKPVGSNATEHIDVSLETMPQLWLRAEPPRQQTQPLTVWNEYGVMMPSQIILQTSRGEQSARISFQGIATPKPLWHYIPVSISQQVEMFYYMLDEGLKQSAIQK